MPATQFFVSRCDIFEAYIMIGKYCVIRDNLSVLVRILDDIDELERRGKDLTEKNVLYS